jgi:myo-inositol-1(or 4)-monophosphatase
LLAGLPALAELQHPPPPQIDLATLTALERTALRLAQAAGARIEQALGSDFAVEFKSAFPGGTANSNPVSEVDRDVETFIREELAEHYPGHAVIGEEMGAPQSNEVPFTWVIDPVDGTTNFINGLPLFACSIGLLYDGWPIAGAIWCSSTHALRTGVYHARRDGPLCFDGSLLKRRVAAAWRGLATEPGRAPTFGALWETRVLGSYTIEFAFVAAGLLRFAYIPRPRLWDAAAGLALIRSAGCAAMTHHDAQWRQLQCFSTADSVQQRAKDLPHWRQSTILGDAHAVERALASAPHLK